MATKGALYLIPSPITAEAEISVLAPQILTILPKIDLFLVENIRTSRRFLSKLKIFKSIESLNFQLLDKDTTESQLQSMMGEIRKGKNGAILSEAGCPGVADPGSRAVLYAHQHEINVVPLVGPSSILLAIMASGLNGQQFAFHGYLPIQSKECVKKITELERESISKNQTQIFIETPYRNKSLFDHLLKNLRNSTYLSVALNLTSKEEHIKTATIANWKVKKIVFEKTPAVFSFLARE